MLTSRGIHVVLVLWLVVLRLAIAPWLPIERVD